MNYLNIQYFQNNCEVVNTQPHVSSLQAITSSNFSSTIETKPTVIKQEQIESHPPLVAQHQDQPIKSGVNNKLVDQNCLLSEFYQVENIPAKLDHNYKNVIPIVKRPTINRFHCNQCNINSNQTFSNLSQLKQHTISIHGCFRCHICFQNFTRRSNLLRHCINHIGVDPYVCKVCSATYKRKEILMKHIAKYHPTFTNANEQIIQKISFSCSLDYLRQMELRKIEYQDKELHGSMTKIKKEPAVGDNENDYFEEVSIALANVE